MDQIFFHKGAGLVGSILAVCICSRVPCNIVGELWMVGEITAIGPWLRSLFPIDNVWGKQMELYMLHPSIAS